MTEKMMHFAETASNTKFFKLIDKLFESDTLPYLVLLVCVIAMMCMLFNGKAFFYRENDDGTTTYYGFFGSKTVKDDEEADE